MEADDPIVWLCKKCLSPKPPSEFGGLGPKRICLACQEANTPAPPIPRPAAAPRTEAPIPSPVEAKSAEQLLREARVAKRCTKCGLLQDYDQFWRRPNVADGRESWCKTCKGADDKARFRAYYEANREAIKARSLARKARLRTEKKAPG